MSRKRLHVVTNTHWDREHRAGFQETRYALVEMIDKLIKIMENDPEFKYFVFDGQTIVLEDYLEVKPHMKDRLKALIGSGRILVGPWCSLPDHFSLNPECIIRNLLRGDRVSREFGHKMNLGYSFFSLGQMAQLPQLYAGFGIDEIIFYNINKPISELINLFVDLKCSRLPVCDKEVDKLIGIISVKDFFFSQDKVINTKNLKKLLSKPFFVPETTNAWYLLQKLREDQKNLAIVVDEYGLINGLVTQEDLMETVVGEVEDLRDKEELYTKSSDDVIIASGKLEISDFENIFDYNLKSKSSVVTIGGWLIEQLEDIPSSGEKYVTDDFLFYILEAEPQKIERIYIRRLKKRK